MTCIVILAAQVVFSSLPLLRSDTPPPLPIPVTALDSLKELPDLVAASVLESGARAPANLTVPQLLNHGDVLPFLVSNYPTHLRDRVTATTPFLWMLIDRHGKVVEAHVARSSGQPALDSLAISVADRLRFTPARVANDTVGVWMPFPLQIGSYERLAAAARPRPLDLSDHPVFTPYTTKPALLNRSEVTHALVRFYPPDLRERRIGGTVQLWAFVDVNGSVRNVQIRAGSGYQQLDDAAVQVAQIMRFKSALQGSTPVDVWIQLPITFNPQW